jgi:non-ribosomal peptide synthetase component F
LHKTTLTFGDAALELLWPLLVGARVVVLGAGLHRDPVAVVEGLAGFGSVYLQVVPSMLSLVLDVVEQRGGWLLRGLRDVTSSGEALSPALVARFSRLLPWVRLHNTWGATEV